ncbi:MAG TPA: PEP-CTERM sorting domain-containing protein [Bryobacteraceae bacterium]|nr:PEP-CTERM sorting domain-containing protein [Bryobacteraceae bacterium]
MTRFEFGALFLSAISTLAVMATPAYCTTITSYSDSATWIAATTGVTTDNFNGLAPSGSYTIYNSGIFQNGVEFIGLSGTTGVMDTSAFSYYNFGTGDAGFVSGSTGVTITLPTPVTAFGINLFTNPTGSTYTVSTLSTPFSVPTSASPPPTFFGVTSDTPFSSVSLTVPSGLNYAFFDNFSFGTAQVQGGGGGGDTVPEAGTFFMIGAGLVGFAAFRVKAKQSR